MNELEKKRLDKILKEVRQERYMCQSIAREALPNERVSKCLRMLTGASVELWKHLKTEKVFYNGLVVCGSVWQCPVCAAKISERRRGEIKQAFDMHKAEGNQLAFLTLTFSHKKKDSLEEILKKFGQAVHDFYRVKAFQKIKEEVGYIGKIGALEVTYGFGNGWHPHRHDTWFITNEVDMEATKKKLYQLWKRSLKKHGLSATEKHGLGFQSGDNAENYMSKHGTWSLEQEMSKSHIKKAREGSFSPFDLLREYLKTEEDVYIKLFQEYAKFFKGKQQLQWSKGLKKQFLVEEKSDEVVAKERTEEADFLGYISYQEWKVILKYEMRLTVLEYAEKYGYAEAIKRIKDEVDNFEQKMAKKIDPAQSRIHH